MKVAIALQSPPISAGQEAGQWNEYIGEPLAHNPQSDEKNTFDDHEGKHDIGGKARSDDGFDHASAPEKGRFN